MLHMLVSLCIKSQTHEQGTLVRYYYVSRAAVVANGKYLLKYTYLTVTKKFFSKHF